jgi:hypothetical protein
MPRPTRKYAFCDAPAVNKGGEHLWDDWLNEKLPPRTRFNARKRLSIDSSPIEFVQVGLKEKVPSVCAECNGGWMSALTAKMKERFSATILEGAPFSLAPSDAVLLAAYTFMKAIVKNYCYDIDEPFFTRAACERLRTSFTIPLQVKMWFAAYQGVSRYAFQSNFSIVSASAPSPLEGMEFFSYTYIFGNLVLQLLAPRWKDVLHRGRPLVTLTPNICWQIAATQFWPDAGKVLSWPPENYLGDSVIKHFIDRFQVPINVPI